MYLWVNQHGVLAKSSFEMMHPLDMRNVHRGDPKKGWVNLPTQSRSSASLVTCLGCAGHLWKE